MTTDVEHQRQLQRALELAYALVNRRERTVAELHGHLERKGVPPAARADAVNALAEGGLLDDERFARLFVSDKRQLEYWGSDRIRRGLLARGIDAEVADAALADDPGGLATDTDTDTETESELDRALALLRRRFPEGPQDGRARERALGVLLRKGYDSELALDALAAHARGD